MLADEFDTSALSGQGFKGAFGVYPFTTSGNIYVSDMDNGLYVFLFTPDVTAVSIAVFDAVYRNGGVRLSWVIASADGLAGFNIYRSANADDGYRRLNDLLLSAAARSRYDDRSVEPGETYWYRLGAVDSDGEFLSVPRQITVPQRTLRLQQNVPNPFNPSTAITYELPAPGHVTLTIYNPLGQQVRTLVNATRAAGIETVTWNGADDAGRRVASGVYFYTLNDGHVTRTRQMLLLK
jgi:hypothetical protein